MRRVLTAWRAAGRSMRKEARSRFLEEEEKGTPQPRRINFVGESSISRVEEHGDPQQKALEEA